MKRIILADNQSLFLAGMVKLLSAEDDLRIVALCADNEQLLRAVKAFRSSIVVVASSLKPNLHELASSIRATRGRLIVVAANTESAKGYATNEVNGVVFRMTTGQELLACINAVAAGGAYRQKKSQSHYTVENGPDWVGERVRDSLARRELMVVGLIMLGYKNKDIARKMRTSEQVVKNYLGSIYTKTGVSSRLDLALYTVRHPVLGQAAESAITPA